MRFLHDVTRTRASDEQRESSPEGGAGRRRSGRSRDHVCAARDCSRPGCEAPEAQCQGAEGVGGCAGSHPGQGLGEGQRRSRHGSGSRGQGPLRRIHDQRAERLRSAQPEGLCRGRGQLRGDGQVGLCAGGGSSAAQQGALAALFSDRELPQGDRVRQPVSRECPDGPGDRRPGGAGLFSAEGLCERAQHGEESSRRLAQADRADPAGDAGEQSGAR